MQYFWVVIYKFYLVGQLTRDLPVGKVLSVDALGLNFAVFRGESGQVADVHIIKSLSHAHYQEKVAPDVINVITKKK